MTIQPETYKFDDINKCSYKYSTDDKEYHYDLPYNILKITEKMRPPTKLKKLQAYNKHVAAAVKRINALD